MAPKQRQEYRKKDLQPKLLEGPTDNSNFVVPGEANVESPFGHLATDKSGGLKDDFADMPPLEDASDHKSKKGLSSHTSDFPEKGMLPTVIQGKGSESYALIEDLHVEVSPPVGGSISLEGYFTCSFYNTIHYSYGWSSQVCNCDCTIPVIGPAKSLFLSRGFGNYISGR